jgi:WXXGXW repeat (2 copies)
MFIKVVVRSLVFSFVLLALSHASFAKSDVAVSVNFGPPALPIYEQPMCPAEGYLWTPGYWGYDNNDGYYWVPGTWVEAPQVGFLWTPGYWGWGGNAFLFHEGYWGPQVGFYGGINYGYGYGGSGYGGGRWEGNNFSYNTYVNRVNTTIIHNTYNTTITNVSVNHVSYNGGNGGVEARPTSQQESYQNERHVGPVAAQTQHAQEARSNPELRASANHGKPPIAATARPGDFKTGAVATREAGGEYKAPPASASASEAKPATENHPEATTEARPTNTPVARPEATVAHPTTHASELQPHTFTPPNTGNAATDKKYGQQQDKLAAKQTQDHAKLQQQQAKEHQQATKKNYNDAQNQQMEQHHAQQTQQVEQKHATQQKQMEQHQAPRQTAQAPESHPTAEKHN